jgi:hypothetical protein
VRLGRTDRDETRYGGCAIAHYPKIVLFNFLRSDEETLDMRPCGCAAMCGPGGVRERERAGSGLTRGEGSTLWFKEKGVAGRRGYALWVRGEVGDLMCVF